MEPEVALCAVRCLAVTRHADLQTTTARLGDAAKEVKVITEGECGPPAPESIRTASPVALEAEELNSVG